MKYFKFLSSSKTLIFILIAVTFLSYINILGNGFAYDDEDFFVNWETIRDVHNIPQMLAGDLPANHQGVYRPLRSVFYVLSYKIWGENPAGYHFQAILIHLVIVLLVYKIIMLISKNKFIALGSGMIFATHPIHTEAITYATASMDTIGIVFFFISFYLYLESQKTKVYRLRYLSLSILAAFIAFFTYEMTLTLPFLIVGYDFVFKQYQKKDLISFHGLLVRGFLYHKLSSASHHMHRGILKPCFAFIPALYTQFLSEIVKARCFGEAVIKYFKLYLPFFSLFFFYIFIRIFIVQIGDRAQYLGGSLLVASRQARLETVEIILQYISLLLFPYNLTIIQQFPVHILNGIINFLDSVDKTGQLVRFLTKIDLFIPIILLVLILKLSLIFFKKSKIILFCTLWFFLSLTPVLSVIPQGAPIAERYLYIPSFSFALLICYLLHRVYLITKQSNTRHLSLIVTALFISLNFIYIVKTITRNQNWKNPITLWTSAVKANTDNSLTHAALGNAYYKRGDYEQALYNLKKSIEYDNSNQIAYFYLGRIYEKKNNYDEAVSFYKKSLDLNPHYPLPYNRLGVIYFKQGNLEKAIQMQEQAVKYAPKVADFNYNLAVSYEKQETWQKALIYYKKALEVNPIHILSLNNSAIILSRLNKDQLAINLLNQAIEINPNNPLAYFNLAAINEKNNNILQAIEYYKKGLALNPSETIAIEKLDTLLKSSNVR